jgi:hypothetical protein
MEEYVHLIIRRCPEGVEIVDSRDCTPPISPDIIF